MRDALDGYLMDRPREGLLPDRNRWFYRHLHSRGLLDGHLIKPEQEVDP